MTCHSSAVISRAGKLLCHGTAMDRMPAGPPAQTVVALLCASPAPLLPLTTSMHLQVSSFFEGSSEEGSLPHVLRQLGIQPTPLQVASN